MCSVLLLLNCFQACWQDLCNTLYCWTLTLSVKTPRYLWEFSQDYHLFKCLCKPQFCWHGSLFSNVFPNDSSCQCVILTILAQPSTEFCIRDPCSGPDFNLNSHLTLGPLHLIPLGILHSYNASCLALVLGVSPSSKTGPWFWLYLRCSQFPSVDQHFGNPGLGAYPYAAMASKWDWISSTFPCDLKNKQLVYIKSSAESFLHIFIKDVRPGASLVNVIKH